MVSTMDENEIEVSEILLQLPSLIAHDEILRLLPFTWASKKRRTATASSSSSSPDNNVFIVCPNCSPKTPLSFSNLNNIEIKSNTDHVNLLGLDEFVKEEPKRKKKIVLPDLNIPLTPPEEEEEDRFQVADRGRVFGDVALSKKAMAAEARRRRIQIVRSKKSRTPRSHLARGGAQVVTVVPMLPTCAFVSIMSVCESDSATQSLL